MRSTRAIFSTALLSSRIFVAPALAANVCPYTSRNCAGTFGCCTNIPAITCCTWPSNYGWSVLYDNMPTTPWYAYRYGDKCITITGGGGGGGTSGTSVCLSVYNSPNFIASVTGNWVVSTTSRRTPDSRSLSNATVCVTPDVIGYVAEDGSTRIVKIPAGRFEEISDYVEEKNEEELLKLEEYTVPLDV